jgi:4-aminobutyrate aminotransferase/(S)-3-amino-2-methylpropionate transaminase
MPASKRMPEDLLAARVANVPRGVLTTHPIVVDRADGAHIWDTAGRRYLDFVGGIGVLNVGHNHPRVIAAVQEQLKKVTHTAFQVAAYEPYIALAERLNQLIGKGEPYKSVFLTTGAEAVENAIKIARGHTNRPGVISFRGGFHGRTLLGVTLTGFGAPYKQNFGPFAGEVFHTAYPDSYRGVSSDDAIAALEEVFATEISPDRVAAIIIEPVQGDGGFLQAPAEFMRALRDITHRHGIVLIADEIQTGFGRTGTMFGFEHSGIQPDLVTVAKSLAGGFPISGVVGRAEIMEAPTPGGLGGTYGGNAIACAAALAVLDAFEEDGLVERAAALGAKLSASLEALQAMHGDIGVVRGVGFMRAIEFVSQDGSKKPDADRAHQVMERARDRGLLVIKCGVHRNIVRFLPPIVLSEADLEEAMKILADALDADRVSAAA